MGNNENETVDIRDFKAEARKRKLMGVVEKAKQAGIRGVNWCLDHPIEALGGITAVAGVSKKALSVNKVKTEERSRETEFYNPRTGMYSKTRRPLTSKEKAYAEMRFKNGDSWTEIFSDMKLLK